MKALTRTGRRSAVAGIGAAIAVALVEAPSASASCPVGVVGAPMAFGFTGGAACYAVPDGVVAVHAVVVGAAGGSGGANVGPFTLSGGVGGAAARVSADIDVSAGDVLYVEVGGPGGSVAATADPGGAGGFNGGAVGGTPGAGGGGGASDVRTVDPAVQADPCAPGSSSSSRLIVAAGGGGGGAASGSAGGDGGASAVDGSGGAGSAGDSGGGSGGLGATAGGSGAAGGGASAGSFACGGAGQTPGGPAYGSGGGGGGGYFGGGGGGYDFGVGGGGGGAGSSFASRFGVGPATLAADVGGTPGVTLTAVAPTGGPVQGPAGATGQAGADGQAGPAGPAGATGPAAAAPQPLPVTSTISLRSTKSTISVTGRGTFTLACSGATPCAGTFGLQVTLPRSGKRSSTIALLTRGHYSLAKGTTKHITFTLNPTARSILRAHHHHLSGALRLTPAGGRTISRTLTLTQVGSQR